MARVLPFSRLSAKQSVMSVTSAPKKWLRALRTSEKVIRDRETGDGTTEQSLHLRPDGLDLHLTTTLSQYLDDGSADRAEPPASIRPASPSFFGGYTVFPLIITCETLE